MALVRAGIEDDDFLRIRVKHRVARPNIGMNKTWLD